MLLSKWGVWGTRIKGLLALTSAKCFWSCQGFTLLFGKVHSLGNQEKGDYATCTLCGYYWPCTAQVQTVTHAHPVLVMLINHGYGLGGCSCMCMCV